MILQEVPKRKFLPTFERYEPLVQDHSSIKNFKICPRKYFFRIVLGYTARKTSMDTVFSWGTAYHKYREILEIEFAKGTKLEQCHMLATQKALVKFKPHPPGVTGKWQHYNMVNMLAMLGTAYKWWVAEKNAKTVKVLATEQAFNVDLGDGLIIGGRLDQLTSMNNRLYIRDFKTTSKKKEYFIKGLNPNDQAIRYLVGITKLQGQRIDGVYFEMCWTSAEGKKEEKVVKSSIYANIVGKTPMQLDEWIEHQHEWNARLIRSREQDIWPMNEESCNFCDYREVCIKAGDDNKAAMLRQNFLHKPWDHEKVEQDGEV